VTFKNRRVGLASAAILSALVVTGCSKAQNANGNIDMTLKYTPTIEEATVSPTPNFPQNINASRVIAGPTPMMPAARGINLTPSATNVMEPASK